MLKEVAGEADLASAEPQTQEPKVPDCSQVAGDSVAEAAAGASVQARLTMGPFSSLPFDGLGCCSMHKDARCTGALPPWSTFTAGDHIPEARAGWRIVLPVCMQ